MLEVLFFFHFPLIRHLDSENSTFFDIGTGRKIRLLSEMLFLLRYQIFFNDKIFVLKPA
jgi:hypothetical protein